MAGPNVTAIISAEDRTKSVIDGFLKNIDAIAGHVQSSKAATGEMLSSQTAALETAASRAKGVFRDIDAAAAGLAASIGTHFLRSIPDLLRPIENETRKILSFSDTTREQLRKIRVDVDSTLSYVQGGPEGAMSAIRAGVLRGVTADKIEAALPTINLHSIETGESLEHGTESLMNFGNTVGAFRDAAGNLIASNYANMEQFKAGMDQAENILITANRVAPGSLKDQMTSLTIDSAVGRNLGVPLADVMAANATLMESGQTAALAGQYVKSAMERTAAPTAGFRSTAASLGIDLDKVQHIDRNSVALQAPNVEAALKQNLGVVTPVLAAHVEAELAKFRAGGSQEDLHAALINLIRTEGGKKSPIQAGNVAERILAPAVQGVEFFDLMRAIVASGGGVAALDAFFGKQVGGGLAPLLTQLFPEFRQKFQHSLPQDHVTQAKEEVQDSFGTKVDALGHAIEGFKIELAEGFKPAIMAGSDVLTPMITGLTHEIGSMSEPVHNVLSTVIAGATAIGAIKTFGGVGQLVAGLGRLAGVVEEGGPLLTGLAFVADLPFIPLTGALLGVATAIEAVLHAAELFHTFDNWLHHRTDAPETPTTPEENDNLKGQAAGLRKTINDQIEAATNGPVHDPRLIPLEDQRRQIIQRAVQGYQNNPAVRDAQKALDDASRARPDSDHDYAAARDAASTLRAELAKRNAMGAHDRYIQQLDKRIAEHEAQSATAGDTELHGMQARRDDLRRNLPKGQTSSTELDTLDKQVLDRIDDDKRLLAQAIAKQRQAREDTLTSLGVANVTQADVDRADANQKQALADAQARQTQTLADAQARLQAAKDAIQKTAMGSKEYLDLSAQIAAIEDEARAIARKRAELDPAVAGNINKLLGIDIATDAYDAGHRGGYRPFDNMPVQYTKKGGFTFNAPSPDYSTVPGAVLPPESALPVVPRGAFDINGPVVGRPPEIVREVRLPQEPAAPVTVNPVAVHGDVTGKVEVALNNVIVVQPSPMLQGLIAHAQQVINADATILGRIGQDDMPSNYGVHRPSPAGGIGHI